MIRRTCMGEVARSACNGFKVPLFADDVVNVLPTQRLIMPHAIDAGCMPVHASGEKTIMPMLVTGTHCSSLRGSGAGCARGEQSMDVERTWASPTHVCARVVRDVLRNDMADPCAQDTTMSECEFVGCVHVRQLFRP